MKKVLREVFIFVFLYSLGLCIKLYDPVTKVILFVINQLMIPLRKIRKSIVIIDFPDWYFLLIILIILLVACAIITHLIRIISNSKTLGFLTTLDYVIIVSMICIPYSMIVTDWFTGFFHKDVQNTGFLILYGFIFYLVCRIMSYAICYSYYQMIKKPVRNCRVILCKPTSETEYVAVEVLAKRLKFLECYSFMRNKIDEIGEGCFYLVKETTLFGVICIDSWKYYRDGSIIQESDEEFLPRLYGIINKTPIKLKTKEENNEQDDDQSAAGSDMDVAEGK